MPRAWNLNSRRAEERTRQAFNPTAYRIHPDGSRTPLPPVERKPAPGWLNYHKRQRDDEAWLSWRDRQARLAWYEDNRPKGRKVRQTVTPG